MPSRALAAILSIFLAASPVVAQVPAAGLTRIGAAAAVKGEVKAQAPGTAVGRVVESGKPMFLNDHVTTDAAGHLQVLLLDETVFTLGPNSDMVLDEFVYDPNTGAGKVTASLAKGTFRFISGKIAHNATSDNMKVKLPVGTMGIRGTIGAGEVDANHSTIILAGPGAHNNAGENPGSIALTNGGSTVVLDRPGFGSTMLPGQPPTPPVNMTGQLGGLMTPLIASSGRSSNGGGAGGSSGAPPNPQQQAATSGGGSVGEASGQTTASGGATATDTSDSASVAQSVTASSNQASQQSGDTIFDGLSSWEQILTVPQSAGQQVWNGSGSYACTGGMCGPSANGTFSFTLTVDFGARTVGGGSAIVSLGSAGSFGGDTTFLNAQNFPASGQAIVTPSFTNTKFNGTTFNLLNANGIIARDAQISLSYLGSSSEQVSGSARSSPRVPGGGG